MRRTDILSFALGLFLLTEITFAPTSIAGEQKQANNYSPIGKRDPFKSSYKRIETEQRKRGPLENVEVEELRLVAVMSGIKTPFALIETPDGIQYVVVRGSPIGRNHGSVSRIHSDGVWISESWYDPARRSTSRTTVRLRIDKAKPSARQGDDHPWSVLWK